MVGENTEAVGAGVGGGTTGNKMPTLEEYGTNLTKLAEEVGVELFPLPVESCFIKDIILLCLSV